MSTATHRPAVLPGIQQLRGFAALLVVLLHATQMSGMTKYYGANAFGETFRHGFVGVDIFFALSGFIMYVTCFADSKEKAPSFTEFIRKRAIRVLPFMWTMTLVYAGLKMIGVGTFDGTLLAQSLFLVPGIDLQPNVLWSLRHELIFYVLFGLCLVHRTAGIVVLATWFFAPAVLTLAGYSLPIGEREFSYPFIGGANMLFAFGVAAAWTCERVRLQPFPDYTIPLLALLIFVACCSVLDYRRQTIPGIAAVGVASAVLLMVFGQVRSVSSLYGRTMVMLGDASFAIYLTHSMVLSMTLGLASKRLVGAGVHIGTMVSVAAAVGFGVLVSKHIEKPLIKIAGSLRRAGRYARQAV